MKRIIYWIINRYFDFVFDIKADEVARQQELSMWYKARRAGWKKKDMGFYYADLQNSGWSNNYYNDSYEPKRNY